MAQLEVLMDPTGLLRAGKAGLHCLATCWAQIIGLKGKERERDYYPLLFPALHLCLQITKVKAEYHFFSVNITKWKHYHMERS